MLAWQNRPQKLVAQYIKRSLSTRAESPIMDGNSVQNKETLKNGKGRSPDVNGRRQSSSASSTSVSPSASMAWLMYEDEQSQGKVGAGGSRVRNESISTI